MPPKTRNSASSASSSSSSSSSDSSSSSSSGSDSSSDSDSSQHSKKSAKSQPNKSPGRAAAPSSAEKAKKKASDKNKKSGFVVNKQARAVEEDEIPNKSKKSSKKAPPPAPKVVPKKSATAKTISKGSTSAPAKSKKYIDTESESEVDDSMSFSMTKLTQKEQKSKKEKEKKSTKSPKEKPKSSGQKPGAPGSKASSSAKAASMFSGSGSEDTDTSLIRDLSGSRSKSKKSPSPPTLLPQKSKVKGSKTSHQQPVKVPPSSKKPPAKKSNLSKESSSVPRRTRNSSVESVESNESLDSDSETEEKKSSKKAPATSSSSKKSGGAGAGSSAVSSPKASTKVERPTTRKQTRGAAPLRKSAFVTGRKPDGASSESESEAEDGAGKSPGKKVTSTPHPKSRQPRPSYPPLENRKCPVPGCDSQGHLSGKLERHFTHDACPTFHNTTAKACRDMVKEWDRRDASRRKALSQLQTKSPLPHASSEQKAYLEKVKEERLVKEELMSQDEEEEIPVTEREMNLKGLTSNWDLDMFREAQARASKVIEEQLKGLPDVKGTKYMEMGRHQMEVWYQSPYPEEYTVLPKIYICEFCLKYMKASSVMKRHAQKCVWKHPPGDEIYRKDKLSVFEVCGKKYKQYCQNLCLIAKSFLDHKTLYYDVEPFLFYVMTAADSDGCHIVGYFSKEKNSFLNYNVSCILTLPPYQRKGYGRLLIDFSYLLSKNEGKIGSPEKPLSDLGLISYRAYWKDILLYYLCNYPEKEISVKAISEEMGIQAYDIVSTLQYLGMIKYWRGKHVILRKEDVIADYMGRVRSRPRDKEISPAHLKWKPYEPTAKEKRQAEQIKKKQEERQKGR